MTTTQDNNQEAREGGDLPKAAKALVAAFNDPTCSLASVQNYVSDLEAALVQPQAGAAVPSDLTDAQITAGSNVLCDCSEPKRIGRNAAIDVFGAMTKAAPAPADTGVAGAGQSIDTPEFRQLLAVYANAWVGDTFPAINEAFGNLIAHIDAQLARQHQETDAARVESEQLKAYRASDRAYIEELEAAARQHQDSKPTDLSKRLRELADTYSEHAAISVLRRTVIAAADEIERLAAAQGEPVAVDGVRWDLFPGYLIDHHEGDPISEEAIQGWVSDMLRDPQYLVAAAAQAVPGDEVRDFNAWVAPLLRFTEQMARQNGEPYFKKLAKRALDHYREQSATKTEGEEQQ